jgi:NAD(P)-dependent dehydrogenase (short-subunit alcohol dehydrogenase family)
MLTDGLDGETYEMLLHQIPLGRVAEPYEVAGTVLFLAGDHAAYITGATINVSGGLLMY